MHYIPLLRLIMVIVLIELISLLNTVEFQTNVYNQRDYYCLNNYTSIFIHIYINMLVYLYKHNIISNYYFQKYHKGSIVIPFEVTQILM